MSIKEFFLQTREYGLRVALDNALLLFTMKFIRAKDWHIVYWDDQHE